MSKQPGLIVLFGSGEIAPSGQKVHDWAMRQLEPPIQVAILETPAGFQPNSALVARKMAEFLEQHLQNYRPRVSVIPARKRGTPHSPDNPELLAPLLRASYIFWGPGSPSYAVRQLRDSLAWQMMVARHRLGAAMVLASAAAIAIGAYTLPVYEIYKVGEDLHWVKGLDLFGAYGFSLAIVSHWDNNEGGAELDTSRGLMGRARFQQLMAMLPAGTTIVGIDEHTALTMDLQAKDCQVMGRGGVTLIREGEEARYEAGSGFDASELGELRVPELRSGIPQDVWARALAAEDESQKEQSREPTPEVLSLVEEREAARARRDWARSDELREQIGALGWQVRDTSSGTELVPL